MTSDSNYIYLLRQTKAKANTWMHDVLLLCLLLALFFTFQSGAYPLLTPDEARYSEVAREMVVSGDYITPHLNGIVFLDKPILHYWLQAIAIKLLGLKEWALRLWPALFGILGCLLTYSTGYALFNRRTGILSAALLATSPLYFALTRYANLDLEIAVLITGVLFSFIIATKNQNKKLVYLAYIFIALALLAKGLIGLVLPGMIMGLWIILLRKWHLLRQLKPLAGLVIIIVIAAPWYFLAQKANPNFFQHFFITEQLSRFLTTNFANHQPWWFYLPILIAGLFPWSLFLPQAIISSLSSSRTQGSRLFSALSNLDSRVREDDKPKGGNDKNQEKLFLLLWPLAILAFFSLPHSKLVSYILPAMPPLALIIGDHLNTLWEKKVDASIQIVRIIFILLAIASATYLTCFPPRNMKFITVALQPYFYMTSGILLLAVLFIIMPPHRWPIKKLTTILIVTMSAIFMALCSAMPKANLPSIKSITTILNHYLQPTDKVISYHRYYYDLPFYTARNIMIVNDWNAVNDKSRDNWERELWYNRNNKIADELLISDKTFFHDWSNQQRIFVVTDNFHYEQLKLTLKSPLYLMAHYQDTVLLSNQLLREKNND